MLKVNKVKGVLMRYHLTIFLFNISLIFLSLSGQTSAANILDSIAYKLAAMHTTALEPSQALLKKSIKPPDATVSEFKWIIESLRSRCFNTEIAIADTIVQSWKTATSQGYSLTLLDTARQLLEMTHNTNLFGTAKVNFVATSKYWLTHNLHTLKKGK